MISIPKPALLLCGLILVLLVGCGEGDEDPLTKAAFVKRANAICAEARTESERRFSAYVNSSADGKSEKERTAEVIDQILPVLTGMTEKLEELTPPAADEAQIEAFIEANEDAIDAVDDSSTSISEAGRELARPSKLAERYGMDDCAFGQAAS